MRKNYFVAILLPFLFLSILPDANSCGYDWVGDCSSAVHLRINGTLDSFIIADCPSGFKFEGMYLGTLRTLSLANARAITWESCINNVTNVSVKYRVYEQGGGPGGFQNLSLDQDYFTLQGPYTTRYRSKASNIDLTTGLSVGKTYVLEVYLVADVDTIGDDFIPETTFTKNNNGQNYRLTFTYGGPNAAPFVVIPTQVKEPACHGESSGIVGVSVWGDHTGLSYNWSNINLNFYQQNNIPAGTYTVTVTGATYAESRTIVLPQPDALTAMASNIQPVSCGGGQGSASMTAQGGTPPYQYHWQNGQTNATATFNNSGSYGLTITDAHQCTLSQSVNIPGGGTIERNLSAKICTGETYTVSGHSFQAGGNYNFTIPGNGGCDTLVHLALTEVNPGALLTDLPAQILVTCSNPSVDLCAAFSADAIYQWTKDGIPGPQIPCLLATAGGLYHISVSLDGCTGSKDIFSEEHLVSPFLSASGSTSYVMDCYTIDSTLMLCNAITNAVSPVFEWTLQGQVISTTSDCTLQFDSFPFPLPAFPLVKVTDAYGCTSTKEPIVLIVSAPTHPFLQFFIEPVLCLGLEKVNFFVLGDVAPFDVTWNGTLIEGGVGFLSPGMYEVVISDSRGCTSTYQVGIPYPYNVVIEDSPNPNQQTGSIEISPTNGIPFTYLWDNGATSSSLSHLAPGLYCVTITDDQNGCTQDTCFEVKGTVAAYSPDDLYLGLAPNPIFAGGQVQVSIPESMRGKEVLFEWVDTHGKILKTESKNSPSGNMLLGVPTTTPDGILLLRAHSAAGQATGKLLLKK